MALRADEIRACAALGEYMRAVEQVHDKLSGLEPHEEAMKRLFGSKEFAVLRLAGISGISHMLGESENSKEVKPVIAKLQKIVDSLRQE